MDTLDRIALRITEKGWSKSEFLRRMDMTTGTFADWRSGRSSSYEKHISRIAEVLDTSVEYLQGKTDQKEKTPVDPAIINEIAKMLRELGVEREDGSVDERRLRLIANYIRASLPLLTENPKVTED